MAGLIQKRKGCGTGRGSFWEADLPAFEPQTHLQIYLSIIAAAKPGQKKYARV